MHNALSGITTNGHSRPNTGSEHYTPTLRLALSQEKDNYSNL